MKLRNGFSQLMKIINVSINKLQFKNRNLKMEHSFREIIILTVIFLLWGISVLMSIFLLIPKYINYFSKYNSVSILPLAEFLFDLDIIIFALIIATVSISAFVVVKKSKKHVRETEAELTVLKKQREEITEDDITISKEKKICLVHKGPIEGYAYICQCGKYYC